MNVLVFNKQIRTSKYTTTLVFYTLSLLIISLSNQFDKSNNFQHPYVLIVFYISFLFFVSSSVISKQYLFQRIGNTNEAFFYYIKELHKKLVLYFSGIIIVNILVTLSTNSTFTYIGFIFYVVCGYLSLLLIIIFYALSYVKVNIKFPSIVIGSTILLLYALNFAGSIFVDVNVWLYMMYSEKFVQISPALFINMLFGYSIYVFLLYALSRLKQSDYVL